MLKKEYQYDSPELLLLVGSKINTSPYEIVFQKLLKKLNKHYALLHVAMKPKHIKNFLLTLNLMDIKGAFILDDIRKPIQKALKTSPIDNLTFKQKKYAPSSTYRKATKTIIKSLNLNGSKVLLVGEMPQIDIVTSELSKIKLAKFELFSKGRKQIVLKETASKPSLHCPNSKKLFNECISNSDFCIIAGSNNFKITKSELKHLTNSCNVIDLREGFINYNDFKSRRFTNNHDLMALILSENIRLWTNEKLEIDCVRKEVKKTFKKSVK